MNPPQTIQYLEWSPRDPATNLAVDEALLLACESGGPEVLRCWEPQVPFVVLGRGNHLSREADLDQCRRHGVPILRRISGGGAVVQMPGLLNYALVLRADRPGLETISRTNRAVLERIASALAPLLGCPVCIRGHTDLCLGHRKFAGNAQRRLRLAVLFHGSILLNADLTWMSKLLPHPSREPAYRQGRPHHDFLLNLQIPAEAVRRALRTAWKATIPANPPPQPLLQSLIRQRYGCETWNNRL